MDTFHNDGVPPTATHPRLLRSRQLLVTIAEVLVVDVETFDAPPPDTLIFTAEDGTQRFLVPSLERGPIVREVSGGADRSALREEPIAGISRLGGTSPGQALVAIIDRLVTANFR